MGEGELTSLHAELLSFSTMLKKCMSPNFVWIFVMENDGRVSQITFTLIKDTLTSDLKSNGIHLNLK